MAEVQNLPSTKGMYKCLYIYFKFPIRISAFY